MSGCEELFLDIHGVKTCVRKGGSGPALVYWHGAGAAGQWFPQHELLAEQFTVYAPDNPGWGSSDKPEWMDAIQDFVLHHDSVFRELGLERPVLVAHSLGGWMASEFAATYPERLSALVLVNAAGMPFTTEPVPDFFAAMARGGEERSRLLFYKPEVADAFFPKEMTPMQRLAAYGEITATARIAWQKWFDDKLPRRLARVLAPTLVLWGAEEKLFPVALAQKFAEAISGAKLQLIAECGHMMPFENPGAFVEAIITFCRQEGAL